MREWKLQDVNSLQLTNPCSTLENPQSHSPDLELTTHR